MKEVHQLSRPPEDPSELVYQELTSKKVEEPLKIKIFATAIFSVIAFPFVLTGKLIDKTVTVITGTAKFFLGIPGNTFRFAKGFFQKKTIEEVLGSQEENASVETATAEVISDTTEGDVRREKMIARAVLVCLAIAGAGFLAYSLAGTGVQEVAENVASLSPISKDLLEQCSVSDAFAGIKEVAEGTGVTDAVSGVFHSAVTGVQEVAKRLVPFSPLTEDLLGQSNVDNAFVGIREVTEGTGIIDVLSGTQGAIKSLVSFGSLTKAFLGQSNVDNAVAGIREVTEPVFTSQDFTTYLGGIKKVCMVGIASIGLQKLWNFAAGTSEASKGPSNEANERPSVEVGEIPEGGAVYSAIHATEADQALWGKVTSMPGVASSAERKEVVDLAVAAYQAQLELEQAEGEGPSNETKREAPELLTEEDLSSEREEDIVYALRATVADQADAIVANQARATANQALYDAITSMPADAPSDEKRKLIELAEEVYFVQKDLEQTRATANQALYDAITSMPAAASSDEKEKLIELAEKVCLAQENLE